MTTITTTNQQQTSYKKAGIVRCVGGMMAGGLVASVAQYPIGKINKNLIQSFKDISDISAEEADIVKKAADKALIDEGLSAEGVKILRIQKKGNYDISAAIDAELKENAVVKRLPENIRKAAGDILLRTLKLGKNAFYTHESNKILLPEKDLALAAFHEMGHAHNARLNVVTKGLQKIRGLSFLAIPIGFIAYKPPKAPGEKPKNKFDKTTDFIKNNAGKLTFCTSLPILIEEGLATIKGNSFAKKVLSEELYQKTKKLNRRGYYTYLLGALSAAACTTIACKISNLITKPKPITDAK